MFCFHKYDVVKNNYQYCKKCGKARVVECPHKWETQSIYNGSVQYDNGSSKDFVIYALSCTKCGTIKETQITGTY